MASEIGRLKHVAELRTSRTVGVVLLVAFVIDVFLGVWLVKKVYFPFSLTTGAFLVHMAEGLSTLTGYIFWALFIAFGLAGPLLMGQRPRAVESTVFTESILRRVADSLQHANVSVPIAASFVLVIPLLGLALAKLPPRPAPPRSGQFVIPSDPGAGVYFRISHNSILMYDLKDLAASSFPMQALHLGDAGAISQIVVSNDPRMLYAADPETGLVHVIDWKSVLREAGHIHAGKTAGSLALTPDARKLYVAITGPIPLGRVRVFNTDTRAEVDSIEGLGCPVDLFASSAAPKLFVATQCGAGYDPLYVVDTRTNRVVAKVSGFAVGSAVAATPDGKTAAVVTVGSPTIAVTPDGKIVLLSLENRLSIIRNYTERTPDVTSYTRQVTAIAMSLDGQFVLVGTATSKEPDGFSGGAILVLNLNRNGFCKGVPLGSAPSAIVISPNGGYHAFLSDGTHANVGDIRALACD